MRWKRFRLRRDHVVLLFLIAVASARAIWIHVQFASLPIEEQPWSVHQVSKRPGATRHAVHRQSSLYERRPPVLHGVPPLPEVSSSSPSSNLVADTTETGALEPPSASHDVIDRGKHSPSSRSKHDRRRHKSKPAAAVPEQEPAPASSSTSGSEIGPTPIRAADPAPLLTTAPLATAPARKDEDELILETEGTEGESHPPASSTPTKIHPPLPHLVPLPHASTPPAESLDPPGGSSGDTDADDDGDNPGRRRGGPDGEESDLPQIYLGREVQRDHAGRPYGEQVAASGEFCDRHVSPSQCAPGRVVLAPRSSGPGLAPEEWLVRNRSYDILPTVPYIHNSTRLFYFKKLFPAFNATVNPDEPQGRPYLEYQSGNLSVVYYYSQEVYHLLPQEEPPVRHYNRCAVVGNSGILLQQPLGQEIDGHDAIFRMNFAPLRGYERFVGNGTTFSIINGKKLRIMVQKLEEEAIVPKLRGSRGGRLVIFETTSHASRHHMLAPILRGVPSNMLCLLNPYFQNEAYKVWVQLKALLEDKQHKEFRPKPMSGFFATIFALQICDHVTLYGFDEYTHRPGNKTIPYHYFDDEEGLVKVHSFDLAVEIFKMLGESGLNLQLRS
eukprot:jgi/Mesvir1/3542/Mv12012-RA.1